MKTEVVLARLQPVHNGHLALIEKALCENDEVYVFVGSADKFNVRNPIPISLRLTLIKKAAQDKFGWNEDTNFVSSPSTPKLSITDFIPQPNSKLYIVPLDDLSDENDNSHDWGFYLYSKIVSASNNPNFTIYYSDGFEIITTWFPSFIMRNNVSLSLLARNATENGISATKVREMILNDDEHLSMYVPKNVYDMRESIKAHIELSKLIK